MKMRWTVGVLVALLLVGGVGFAHAGAPIRLGVIAPLSGPGTSYGLGIKQGAEMAAEEINKAGGIGGRQIQLVVVDDASNPAQSVTAMQRLVSQDAVDLIVGGWGSSQVLANMEVVERAGVPYIVVGATNPRITSTNNKWTFRVIQTDSIQAREIAKVAADTLGLKRIAVFNDSNDYGVGNKEAFLGAMEELKQKPVEIQAYNTADKDFTPQLTRIKGANPDGLAIFGTIPGAPAIMNQARDLGLTARFIGTGGLANENLITLAPKASAGTVLTTLFHEDVDADGRAWADRYNKQFSSGSQPPRPVLAAWQYRVVRFIVPACLEKAGTDKAKVRDCFAGWRGKVFGVAGEVYFDQTKQLVQESVLVEVKDGTFAALKRK
jgi:branched-chain amino acid transport system substrate-binding protein